MEGSEERIYCKPLTQITKIIKIESPKASTLRDSVSDERVEEEGPRGGIFKGHKDLLINIQMKNELRKR